MDVKDFSTELLSALGELDFVEDIDLQVEGLVVAGKIILNQGRFVEVYYNELTGTIAFALIAGEGRIWGLDKDKIRGWHMHPLKRAEEHIEIKPLSVTEVIKELAKMWENL